jgi:hypothetical protein
MPELLLTVAQLLLEEYLTGGGKEMPLGSGYTVLQ